MIAGAMGDYLQHLLVISERQLFGNSLGDWLLAGSMAAAVWCALWLLRHLIASRYQRYLSGANHPRFRVIAELAASTRQFFMLAIALYAGHESLILPAKAQRAVTNLVLLLILVQTGIWAVRSVRLYLQLKQQESGADRVLAGSIDIILFVARIIIWSLLILVTLENFGVNITALLAGLGVGGVAVALALQNVLGDLFASLSIALDKPFIVGDTLTIDAYTGTVERIGIKTTRLRSDAGTIRVPYATPAEKILEIPQLLERIVRDQAHARFERCHLKTLGEWALQFELSYFGRDPDGYSLLDLQHAVNCRILEEFSRAGIEFAVPTQRVLAGESR
jgi:small-conductance mechanosensitive channel